jgi:hypothetical protein
MFPVRDFKTSFVARVFNPCKRREMSGSSGFFNAFSTGWKPVPRFINENSAGRMTGAVGWRIQLKAHLGLAS